MSKSLIAGVIASFQIAILFIFLLLFYDVLSPIATTPETQAALESGQEATINAFNWWLIIDGIGFLIVIIGVIFGIIYAVIKIAERTSSGGFYPVSI